MSGEKRQHKRLPWSEPAKIVSIANTPVGDCLIKDISATGARLWVRVPELVPDWFTLHMSGGLTPKCGVRWRHGNEIGVQFGK